MAPVVRQNHPATAEPSRHAVQASADDVAMEEDRAESRLGKGMRGIACEDRRHGILSPRPTLAWCPQAARRS